jgi:SAM-dependent methyltransferase
MRDQAQCLSSIHHLLHMALSDHRPIRILEAGGGSYSHIRLDRASHISVIDISPEQLSRNTYADIRILGDLEAPDAIDGLYDLIVCFDVLEHLQRPNLALSHMVAGLDKGGLLVIGCPNRSSTKGMITRFTPHNFHIWYYKAIRGVPDAGQPGHAPFETFLDAYMGFEVVQRQLEEAGLAIRLANRYEGPAANELQSKKPFLYALYDLPAAFLRALGQSDEALAATDWIIVAQKPAQSSEKEISTKRQA